MSSSRSGQVSIEQIRRDTVLRVAATLALTLGWLPPAAATSGPLPALRIGVSLALTGPDARWGVVVGPVFFDLDGDLERPAVSIDQVRSGGFRYMETTHPTGIKPGDPR